MENGSKLEKLFKVFFSRQSKDGWTEIKSENKVKVEPSFFQGHFYGLCFVAHM